MFLLLDYRPLKQLYGVYFWGSRWPPNFVQGGLKVGKLRFRRKVARSGELVCRDRVHIVPACRRGDFGHSPSPLGGAPTRFRSRISVEEYSTEDHRFRCRLFTDAAWATGFNSFSTATFLFTARFTPCSQGFFPFHRRF